MNQKITVFGNLTRLTILLLMALAFSCQPELVENQLVYFNDFESGDAGDITGAVFSDFNGTKVLGNFYREGFTLHLGELPEHNYLVIAFDLYIHDSWDGNSAGVDGPDIWGMELDEWVFLKEKTSRMKLFETTFSNSVCFPNYCLMQSYPDTHPFLKEPKTGAFSTNLPGFCSWAAEPRGSTLYKIEKIFAHSAGGMALRFYDRLNQNNAPDPKCDESWSLDNLRIRTITVK